MNRAIVFLKETKLGILISADCKWITAPDFEVCKLTHDNWEDFLSYCNFFEYEQVLFICNGKRIIEIVKQLNSLEKIERFSVYTETLLQQVGLDIDVSKINFELEELSFNEEIMTQQGSYACATGIYPPGINSLKHIYLTDTVLEKLLTMEVFLQADINATIIIPDKIRTKYPFIVVPHTYIQLEKYELIDKKQLELEIDEFKKTGKVKSYSNSAVIDIGYFLQEKDIKRIFISPEGIYADMLLQQLISPIANQLDMDIIKNNYSITRKLQMSGQHYHTYNILATLGYYFKVKEFYSVTSCTQGLLPPNPKNHHLIGIITEDRNFLYNTQSKKFFEVERKLLMLLEFYIKDQLEHPLLAEWLVVNNLTIQQFLINISKAS